MKAAIGLCLLIGLAASKPQDAYTTKYDKIDLDAILNNERLYKIYFNCLTDQGKCTEDGKILKDNIPDALQTGCRKCSQRQKDGSEKVLKFVLEKRPADYKIIEKIYDPDGVYKKRYNEEAKKHGIKFND